MSIITGRENVLAVYETAAKKGWVIPCLCSENLTTTEAILTAASEFAAEYGYERIPVTLAITNQYDHRSQSVFYTHTRRWDIGLKLFRASIDILAEAFPNVDILIHLDHAQHDTDAQLLESDLSMYSSVMYDASTLPMEENIAKTRAYVQRKGNEILIEGACDEIVDATGEARCEITSAEKCEHYMKQTGVDIVIANLGTEHRASGQDLHYYYDAARAIKEKIGPRICLHGTSSVSNDQIGKLFEDGICKVNIWTALERDASPALTEWTVKNAAKCGGAKLEQKLIDEGYLTASSKAGDKASLQHFTTAARQEIVFNEMKKIARGYLDLWYR
ncbi:MAG: class II fructose-bisphosphate aldolase [Oscillospiraceae bacterium]|nr:class II fructose-bisphosphate aldolase [Oscillospiraceae bacterium]